MRALKVDSLKNKREFDFVFRNGYHFSTPYFNLHILFLTHITTTRKFPFKILKVYEGIIARKANVYVGLSVSRKIGSAPKRNLYKRRMRALCQEKAFESSCIVFVPKTEIATLSYQDFASLCYKALNLARKRQQ